MWNKLSIRNQLTIATCLILIMVSVTSTVLSYVSSQRTYEKIPDIIKIEYSEIDSKTPMIGNEIPIKDSSPYDDVIKKDKIDLVFDGAQKNFVLNNVAFMVLIIFVGTFLMWYVCGRLLYPIQKLSESVGRIDSENLSNHLAIPKKKDEIFKLTNSINNMLCKIDASYLRQKRFSNNIAHELKTPLTVIQTNLEVLDMDDFSSIEEYNEVFKITSENVEKMTNIVRNLMLLNRCKYEEVDTIDAYSLISNIVEQLST